MGKKAKPPAAKREKTTVNLTAQERYRLDVEAAHLSLERGRKVTRSDLISEIIRPRLRSIVVSIRSGPVGENETAE